MTEILMLFNQTETTHSQNWMFFIVVVFGILGYCFTEKYKEIEKLGLIILAFGFAAFSIYNITAMVENVNIHNQLLVILKKASNEEVWRKAVDVYQDKELWRILVFHPFFSLLTILVIFRKYLIEYLKTLQSETSKF
jgi:hypothetical protein